VSPLIVCFKKRFFIFLYNFYFLLLTTLNPWRPTDGPISSTKFEIPHINDTNRHYSFGHFWNEWYIDLFVPELSGLFRCSGGNCYLVFCLCPLVLRGNLVCPPPPAPTRGPTLTRTQTRNSHTLWHWAHTQRGSITAKGMAESEAVCQFFPCWLYDPSKSRRKWPKRQWNVTSICCMH